MIAIAYRLNHVLVDMYHGQWARVMGLSHMADLDPNKINFETTPWWVHQVIYTNRRRIGKPKGLDIYMPVWCPFGFRYAGKAGTVVKDIWIPKRVLLPPTADALAKWTAFNAE
jgi:hypothetical protein